MTTEQELERQAQDVEQARSSMEEAARVMLLAALSEWLKHFTLTPERSEGRSGHIIEAMLAAQALRAVRAAGRALWPSVVRATGDQAAGDVPRTPRIDLAMPKVASDWAREHAKRTLQKARKERAVDSPAGVDLPPPRSSSMQPQRTANRRDEEWARAAARSLSVRAIGELSMELQKEAPAPIGADLYKVWITRGDHRVRDSHRDLHGTSQPLQEPSKRFGPEVLSFPGDPRAPLNETIGCRCVLVYSVGPIGNAIGDFPDLPEEPLAASAAVELMTELTNRPIDATWPMPFHSHGDSAFVAMLPADPLLINPDNLGNPGKDGSRWLAPEELHVTLGYVGKNDAPDVGPDAYHAIDELCCSLPWRYAPVEATVTGVDVFDPDDSKAVVLVLDAPPLHQIHDELTHHLENRNSLTEAYMKYPSYKPHMTIGYDVDPETPWVQEMVGKKIVLDRVVSTWKQLPPRHFRLTD